ncbi:MAG TPA: 50S ribosomal protein L14 [Kosmotogaceae bacterium]|jgi:large subunit ribosomal protein L14|nr:MAG: 50S ribosomal protein L14 [Thermotogales bacterium 46_20]HAA85294.1 50S ribosomal protein L14 [Kosmotogaceae bacterium]
MIQNQTYVKVADNSGARVLKVIRVTGGYQKRSGTVGDIVVASVREATPHTDFKKGDIVRAVVVRTRKGIRRNDGSHLKFDDNAAVIIDPQNQPRGTRVFGPIAREIREKGFAKIASLAQEVW